MLLVAGGHQEEDLLAAQENPRDWDCLAPGLIQRQSQGRKAGVNSFTALETADPPGGKGMKARFLFWHQMLMKTLTWAESTGACQRMATRNQSSAFRRFSRQKDRRLGQKDRWSRGKEW